MLIDTKIIHSHARLDVLAQRHEVMWRDGTQVWLHHVQCSGHDAPLLRALQVDGAWTLLDLSRALPAVADDLRVQPKRDAQGLIFFALRGMYASAGAFVDHVRPHLQSLKTWAPMQLPEAA